MKKEKDVLPKVPRKKGHQLDEDVIYLKKQFYEEDEYSTTYPGPKEYKSVTLDGVKRKKQKKLLLLNKELYLEFQKKTCKQLSGKLSLKIYIGVSTKFLTNNKMGGYSK